MKYSLHAFLLCFLGTIASLAAGCASKRPVEFLFTDENSSAVTNVVAVTFAPATFFERVFNPIGTFYHPVYPTRSDKTNLQGIISYDDLPKGYSIFVFIPESTTVKCVYNGQTILIENLKFTDNGKRRKLLLDNNGTVVYFEKERRATERE